MSKDEERYDVSQHDGITKGGWTLETIDNYPIEADKLKIVSRVGRWTRNVAVLDEDIKRVDLHAIFALPKILDALKKAYEEVDNLEWLLAKAHGEGNMVHSLVHLGVTQQLEVSKTENERLRDALHVINEDMKDCEEGGMPHVRKIANFVNDVCESEKIASE